MRRPPRRFASVGVLLTICSWSRAYVPRAAPGAAAPPHARWTSDALRARASSGSAREVYMMSTIERADVDERAEAEPRARAATAVAHAALTGWATRRVDASADEALRQLTGSSCLRSKSAARP